MSMTPEQIQEIARSFVQPLDRYARWSILTGGLAFTTYEEELEAAHGVENLLAIKEAIYVEIRRAEA